MSKNSFIFSLLIAMLHIGIISNAQVRYVKAGGSGDGSSWANASGNIQTMIEQVAGLGGGQVWVAGGTYHPTTSPNGGGYNHFSMRSNVTIYGGFPDFGDPAMDSRSPLANPTILSGDFNNDDEYSPEGYPFNNLGENSTRVFNHEGISLNSGAILDGFTISGCAAGGAAMYNDGGTYEQIIRNCSFTKNKSAQGAIYNSNASITFENCAFYQNSAAWNGSACVFEVDYYDATPTQNSTFINCTFYNNYLLGNNLGPAATITGSACRVNFFNCTFSKNKNNSTTSDAVAVNAATVNFYNCISWNNDGSAGLYGTYTATNCIFQGIGGATDPILDPDGLIINGGMVPSIAIIDENSPAIDAGNDTYLQATDTRGFARKELSGIGGSSVSDIGAFEYQGDPSMLQVFTEELLSADKNQALAIGLSYFDVAEPPSQKGFTWSISNNRPLITTDYYSTETSLTSETFNYLINHPESPTIYARAYAISNDGTSIIYGNVMSLNFRYVKQGGTGNGLSWANASGDLQTMIEEVYDNGLGKGEIWVAAGTYKPNSWPNGGSGSNQMHFSLRPNVTLYGGFPASGNPGLSSRSPLDYPSILSGDLGNNDTYDADGYLATTNVSDNIEHIFWHNNITLDATAILDGFTISNGYNSSGQGAAVYNSNTNVISLTLKNVILTKNSSNYGAVYDNATSAKYINCTFTKNSCQYNGAAVFEVSNTYRAESEFTNCTFYSNKTLGSTAAIGISGGQMYTNIYNCTFFTNNIGSGNIIAGNTGYLNAYNSIFWNNSGGHGLSNTSLCTNCILQGIDTDPLLDATNGLYDNGGLVSTVAIGAGSSAVDAANDIYAPLEDARGITRKNTTGLGSVADIGAFELNNEYKWVGEYSSDWNVGLNWSSSSVPESSFDISIPASCEYYPEIESTVSQNGIAIDLNAKLDIMSAGQLTVTGTLLNNGTLTIHSDQSGTGSLIHNSANVEAIVERYIEAGKWHIICPPLTDVPNSILATAPWGDINPNFYTYQEANEDYWITTNVFGESGWTRVGNTGTMTQDKGYFYYFTKNYTYTLSGGVMKTGDAVFTGLSYSGHSSVLPSDASAWDTYDGWNLIGNPFCSAIDLDAISPGDMTDLNQAIYVYNPDIENYQYYEITDGEGLSLNGSSETSNNVLPINQGFFVKVMTGGSGGSLTIPASARTHSNNHIYKSSSSNRQLLKFYINYEKGIDEMVFRFKDEAMATYDKTDILKRFSWNANIPQIYSLSNDEVELAVNSQPESDFDEIIPVAYYDKVSGEKTIYCPENSLKNTHVYFIDKLEQTTNKIEGSFEYHFTHQADADLNRFEIKLSKNTSPEAIGVINNYNYMLDEQISIPLGNDLFIDYDLQDVLTITCQLSNGEPLPEYLNFDINSMSITGTAGKIGTINLQLVATDIFGESAAIDFSINVSMPLSNELHEYSDYQVYPNPCDNRFSISSPENCTISIYNLNGQQVFNYELVKGINIIDTNLKSGMYFIHIKENDNVRIEKLIIETN